MAQIRCIRCNKPLKTILTASAPHKQVKNAAEFLKKSSNSDCSFIIVLIPPVFDYILEKNRDTTT